MRLHHKIAELLGYDLLKRKTKQAILESHLMVLFGRLDIDLIFDVGANKGQYAKFIRKLGYKGRILSFEPVKATYDILLANSANDPNWLVFNMALGAANEQQEINVSSVSELASMREPSQYGLGLFGNSMESEKKEIIQVMTLATFLDNNKELTADKKNIFLKMDTQGYDMEVFQGAISRLEQIAGIQSELPLKAIYDNVESYHDILSVYEKQGFEITGIYPVSRDSDTFGLIEADCVLVNTRI